MSIWTGLLGGALIGLGATVYWAATGRIAGVSGILGGALRERPARDERLAFLGGLVVVGVVAGLLSSAAPGSQSPPWVLVVAGLLVGFGTQVGSGCTSGHGVCGLGRLSLRSLAATLTFMAAGAAVVYVVEHVLRGAV